MARKRQTEIAAYLQDRMDAASGDPALIAAALGEIARSHGMMKLARETGLTREALYRALSPEGNPNFGTILKVTKALGIKLVPKAA
jgi:probable addiction module antidote protein